MPNAPRRSRTADLGAEMTVRERRASRRMNRRGCRLAHRKPFEGTATFTQPIEVKDRRLGAQPGSVAP
jgi:hypothetical protein